MNLFQQALRERIAALADTVRDTAAKVSRLQQRQENVIKPRLYDHDDDIVELQSEVEQLRGKIDELEDRQDAVFGVDDSGQSSPEKRAQDVREAMIRQHDAGNGGTKGVKWHVEEVKSQLTTLGHKGFSDPVYDQALEDAAGGEGFDLDSKPKATSDGRTLDVKAIRLKPDELPPKALSNQLTTADTPTPAADGGEPHAEDTEQARPKT